MVQNAKIVFSQLYFGLGGLGKGVLFGPLPISLTPYFVPPLFRTPPISYPLRADLKIECPKSYPARAVLPFGNSAPPDYPHSPKDSPTHMQRE